MKIFSISVAYLLLLLSFIPPAFPEEISQLKEEIEKIRKENKFLQEQIKRQNELIETLQKRVEGLEIKETLQTVSPPVEMEKEKALLPKLEIRGFTDVSFKVEKASNKTDEEHNTFSLGMFDLFITSELSDEVSVLVESVIEYNAENETMTDLERLYIKYELSDLLNIKAGRMHPALGYWHPTFHHGGWLQTTIFRPEVLKFEDDGGILPVHSTGIEFSGKKEFEEIDLEYALEIMNGRGKTRTEIQTVTDRNDSKAINLQLALSPKVFQGLGLGLNIYKDKIPPNTSVALRNGEIAETIYGGFLRYLKERNELLFEIFNIEHDDEVTNRDYSTLGLYLQFAHNFKNNLKTYYRFDWLDFGNDDPYFSGIDKDILKNTIGLRWDPFTWNAIKMEYSYEDKKQQGSDSHSLTLNTSFTF